MKKFFAIAILATAFVACNNSGEGKENKDTVKVDSPAVVDPVIVDSPAVKVDSPAVKTDSPAVAPATK